MSDNISRQAAIDESFEIYVDGQKFEVVQVETLMGLPSVEPKEVYCSMASRTCFANGKEVAWCLTCPHISEEDRELVRKAVEGSKPKTGKWIKLDMHAHLADHKCTSCGQECYVPTCMGDPMYDFCPNCGAKMVREDGE